MYCSLRSKIIQIGGRSADIQSLEAERLIFSTPKKCEIIDFPEKYRELFIIVAIAMRDPTYTDGIKNHIKRAMKLGATVDEIVQAISCTLAPCGMMAPIKVFTLLKEVIDEEA